MNLEHAIEAILFYKAEPVTKKELGKMLETTLEQIDGALQNLAKTLAKRGVVLMEKDGEVEVRTAPSASPIIERLQKEELARDLGRAGLETLAIVLYEGPISRREIDYIRGVNSSFILRNLLIRGLIEKSSTQSGERSFSYAPTFELLGMLGIQQVSELPEYATVRAEIERFKKASEENDATAPLLEEESETV